MAPAVILIGCLLVTMSCSTTAQSTTPPTAAVLTTDTTTTTTSTSPPAPPTTIPDPPTPPDTTSPVNPPTYASCGNPDLCCSGLNNSCHRENCYCDVACLRLHDCCPDFKHTCLTVNNSTNSTNPNNTLPLTGTCSEPTLCCSGVNYDCFRGCFCDEACEQLNDCCPDLNSTCIFNTTTAAPPFTSTAFDPTEDPLFTSTAALSKDVPTVLIALEARVLTKSSSSEEERQAVMRQVGTLLGSLLGVNNTDIISLKVTRIKLLSSPYD